jgi:hypothetical protein
MLAPALIVAKSFPSRVLLGDVAAFGVQSLARTTVEVKKTASFSNVLE